MRAKPGRSYSGENGLALMRTSRMADFGGRLPPVKPSMKISPPPGPGAGPARACNCRASSSGSSERAASLALAQHDAAAVGFGRRADAAQLVLHGDHLRFAVDGELGVEDLGLPMAKSFFCATENPLAVMRT